MMYGHGMAALFITGGCTMKFKMVHNNFNVLDLEKSLKFYKEALGLVEIKRKGPDTGEFILVFLGDERTEHQLELTWLRDRKEAYDLGDNEIHLAFRVDDYELAYEKHREMGCIVYENKPMGIYFIADPDGYWLEILPEKR
jgi:lactoylglutathione lyase